MAVAISIIILLTLVSTLTVTPPKDQSNDVFQYPLITATELRNVGKGEIPEPVGEATTVLYSPEYLALIQIRTLSIITLFVVGIYLIAKYQNRIVTRIKSL